MGLSMRSRQEVSKEYAKGYRKASKGSKTEILNSFIELTGYNRCYASYILRHWGKKVFMRGVDGERLVVIGEFVKRKRYRKRCKKYDESV
ncbi:MAG: transposase, partial [Candidatus Aminicenantes bacterium]|nr:transposase [Candidatus Aminicenantes bacterium]